MLIVVYEGEAMEIYCSLKAVVGGICGPDPKSRQKSCNITPVLACRKEISGHERSFQFSGHTNESDLILSRAGLFTCPKDIATWTIWIKFRFGLDKEVH